MTIAPNHIALSSTALSNAVIRPVAGRFPGAVTACPALALQSAQSLLKKGARPPASVSL